MPRFDVDPDVRRASTLPPDVYRDPDLYRIQIDRVFSRTWHVVADAASVRESESAVPATLLPGSLDEPLALTRDAAGALHALSNVCTHRGNLVLRAACQAKSLRCGYHGRRFGLDGRFAFMPEFDGAERFPSPADDLPRVPVASWGPLLLASAQPAFTWEEQMAPLRERLDPFIIDSLTRDEATSRDYEINAHWALYCDNYLEGFHVPFVHQASLAGSIDYASYRVETFRWANLQTAFAADGEPALELPPGHPDAGRRVAGYYAWLFPATMINVYPWGLSINAVQPLGPARTRIAFISFVRDPGQRARGAGADLHRVEMEDEAVVEGVQRGVRSRFYRGGRFSPSREAGVHHFHRLMAEWLAADPR